MLDRLQKWAKRIKRDVFALYLAGGDPRVHWYAKALAAATAAYAFSPIDIIPDFIPVVGYLDDLIIVPLAIIMIVKLIPPEVMAELRDEADRRIAGKPASSKTVVIVVVVLWIAITILTVWAVWKYLL